MADRLANLLNLTADLVYEITIWSTVAGVAGLVIRLLLSF